jgi:hypothetical protein
MKTIIEMAHEVKMPYDFVTGEPINLEKLEAFAALVRADERDKWMERAHTMILGEREACAKVCETYNKRQCYNDEDMAVAKECATAIRARGGNAA